MKNLEKYFDLLVEIGMSSFGVKKEVNKPENCREIYCDDCVFGCCCDFRSRLAWLNAEFEESRPTKLTDDEIAVLKNIEDEWKWIARDKDGLLGVYDGKPTKDCVCDFWDNTDESSYDGCVELPIKNLFSFIKWEDENPYNIDELLKQNGVER